MTGLTGRAGAAGAAVALATLLAGWGAGAADGRDGDLAHRTDLTATALTGPQRPAVVDDVVGGGHGGPGPAKVDTTASAAADCDGCSADASALHVVYLDRPTDAVLANVAVAWSRCAGCRSTSLSVQVVVLRSPAALRADNRALAVNAACQQCRTTAVAYQLVVVGGRGERISRSARRDLEAWVATLAGQLRETGGVAPTGRSLAAADPSAPDATAADLAELERLVAGDLDGARTVRRDADVATGAGPAAVNQAGPDPAA